MIGQYDKLVKGWIFGSVNEKVLKDLVDLGTAHMVWMKLESLFNPPVSDTEGTHTEGESSNSSDVSTMMEELKYIQALNVDVSNFVSEKLVDESNYYTWKNEMLNLIESHELLHIIHAEARFPRDKADPLTKKYDSLVRGWILSTMNDSQQDKYRMYRSVQKMWRRLESTFTYQPDTSDSDTEDTEGILESNADDSSNKTEDLKYMQLKSNVNIYDFVSVKLSGRSNYDIWKDQMLHLLRSHNLLHIIDEKAPSQQDKDDSMTKKYDSLVRGWLLSTMNDEESHKYRIYRSVKLMWSRVKPTFDETEDLNYMEASNINVSNFVSVNLSYDNNYSIWKAQMLYFLECHNLLHIINDAHCSEEDKYDELVKGWLLCTMNDDMLEDVPAEDYVDKTAKDIWEKLESCFTEGYRRPEPVVYASTQDLKYTQALNVNVSNFVTAKLSGHSNYELWKAQMLYLIESQKLLHIINEEYTCEGDKYNTLVKGWIISTMKEQLLNNFTNLLNKSAKNVWDKLKSTFDPSESDSNSKDERSPLFKFKGTEFEIVPEMGDMDRIKIKKGLYEAAVEGCWWKAKSILKIHKYAATEAITTTGDTILHLAVEMGQNYFLEKLLDFLKGEDIEKKNNKGRTALHVAAVVGNIHAAQLLVQKRSQLLQSGGCNDVSPSDLGCCNDKLNTYAYLVKCEITSGLETHSIYDKKSTIAWAIVAKEYDLAHSLLKKFPECAREDEDILLGLTITFPSDLGFIESFIYPCI